MSTTARDENERYRLVSGSQSDHCCFAWTVVDTTLPRMIQGEHYNGQFEPLCECVEEEDAKLIVAALNAMRSKDSP
jgi:hypothetical protein